MIIGLEKAARIGKRLEFISKFFANKKLKTNLKKADIKISAINYVNACLVNAFVYFLLLLPLAIINPPNIFIIIIITLVLFFILLYYPKINSDKIGKLVDSELLFALEDLLIQVKADIDLYRALINVVEGNYGYVSKEFQNVVDDVESGKSMVVALKNLALKTNSKFMKRVAWQLMNNVKSGSDITKTIETLIMELETYYHSLIKSYTKELNVLTLIYLTLAIVAPTIGISVLIIISSFGGISIDEASSTIISIFLILLQPIVIGLINSRRPLIKI